MRSTAAILLLFGTVALLSCSGKDETQGTDSEERIAGNWYAEYDKTGTVPNFERDGLDSYTKVVQYYEFEPGGNGRWVQFMFDGNNSCPIWQNGGLIGLDQADGLFSYTVGADGKICITLRKGQDNNLSDPQWTLTLSDGIITGTDGNISYTLTPATESRKQSVNDWEAWYHGGGEEVTEVYPGTPRRTYSLDWEIKNEDRQKTCLTDIAGGNFRSDFDQIIFEYNSVGPDLRTPVRLTGSINMPRAVFNKEKDARHLLIVTQWTHASRYERLTQNTQSELEFYMNSIQNTIAISSDLYGWTLTADMPQAYCCPEITAVETLDCWDAAMEILKEKGYKTDNLPISNVGYSSAGMQAIGIQRFIDENRPDIRIALTAAAASPFDINTIWQDYVNTNTTSFVCALPLIMVAYNETYHLGLDYKDIFMPPLCNNIREWILDKNYNSDKINELIGMDRKVDQILTPAARDHTQGIGLTMYRKFMENSLCDSTTTWQPDSQTQFFIMHSPGDTYMTWQASVKMAEFLKERGAKVVTDFNDSGDHVFNAAFVFFMESCMVMENSSNPEDSQQAIDGIQALFEQIRENPEAYGGLFSK